MGLVSYTQGGSQELPKALKRLVYLKFMYLDDSYGQQTLTHALLHTAPSSADTELIETTNVYFDNISENLPASASCLDSLGENSKGDNVCSKAMEMCQLRWPKHNG